MATQPQLESWTLLKPRLGLLQQAVYDVIALSQEGATLREIADKLSMELSSVSGRVTELSQMRLVAGSGQTRVNPKSGKRMTVWIATKGQLSLLE